MQDIEYIGCIRRWNGEKGKWIRVQKWEQKDRIRLFKDKDFLNRNINIIFIYIIQIDAF